MPRSGVCENSVLRSVAALEGDAVEAAVVQRRFRQVALREAYLPQAAARQVEVAAVATFQPYVVERGVGQGGAQQFAADELHAVERRTVQREVREIAPFGNGCRFNCAPCSRQSVKVTLRKRQLCQRACSAASGPTVPRSTLRSVQSSACCDRMPASTGEHGFEPERGGAGGRFFSSRVSSYHHSISGMPCAQVGVGAAEMAAAEEPLVGRPGRGAPP